MAAPCSTSGCQHCTTDLAPSATTVRGANLVAVVGEVGPAGLRERTRRTVQAEIAAAAMRLFLDRGFEATTMEQIAAEVGISRRSLFRYFGTKEDIVLGDHAEQGRVVREALEARPP